MLDSIIREMTLDLIVGAVRHHDPAERRRLAGLYWDLMYIYRFGILRVPIPNPSAPLPNPSPEGRVRVHEEVLFGLLDTVDRGDPDPEPSITTLVANKSIRLSAAKALAVRLTTAQQQLGKEIERLEALR
jgi:hypothetical protein